MRRWRLGRAPGAIVSYSSRTITKLQASLRSLQLQHFVPCHSANLMRFPPRLFGCSLRAISCIQYGLKICSMFRP